MKKIIGILGVAVIAATMFFSANAVSGSSTDTTLANLITMNKANAETAEEEEASADRKYKNSPQACSVYAYVKVSNGVAIGISMTEITASGNFSVEYKLVAGKQDKCVSGGNLSCSEIIGFWNSVFGNTGDCVPNQPV